MSVRIHETGKHNLPAAVDLLNLFTVLSNPWIAHRVSGFAAGDNFAARTEHCTIFNGQSIRLHFAYYITRVPKLHSVAPD